MEFVYAALAFVGSYIICIVFTHPRSKIWKKFPSLKYKRFEILPSIRVRIKGKYVHFHHWFNFSILLGMSIFAPVWILDSWITRGALLGVVIEGLSIREARKIIYDK